MDQAAEQPRIAVWGLGRMGQRHAGNLAQGSFATLAGVADIDPSPTESAARTLDVPGHSDLDALITETAPDGVVIATHASNHADAIATAAAHGVQVFCEKPLAFDGPAAARVLADAGAQGVHVQMGFQMRFDDDLRKLGEEVRDGKLGAIFQLRSTVRDAASPARDYLESSGGYFRDTAPHCLDYGRWLLGEVEEVVAAGAALSDPVYREVGDVDNGVLIARYASGALGTINLSRVAGYGFDTAVEVLGELGAVRVPGERADGLERYEPGRVSRRYVADFLERFRGAYVAELRAFAALLSGAGPGGAADGLDGLATMRIAEAAVISCQQRRAVRVEEVPW